MQEFLIGLSIGVLLILAAVSANLRAVYAALPAREVKRRARSGEVRAQTLYQVSRHGKTADSLLMLISFSASSVLFVMLSQLLPAIYSIPLLLVLMLVLLVYLPRHVVFIGKKSSIKLSPYIARILVTIWPLTNRISVTFSRGKTKNVSSEIFEKEDLVELIKRQKQVSHNRIDLTELELAEHVLQFGDKKVEQHMVPRKSIHFVHAEEPIGPVLLAELHDSGFSRFPVRTDEDNQVVGTLYLKDLIEKRTHGIVSNVMSPDVYYIRDDANLEQVLRAFIRTKHHLFMVIDEFEEIVGMITIEDVLEQILGRKLVDEFDHTDETEES